MIKNILSFGADAPIEEGCSCFCNCNCDSHSGDYRSGYISGSLDGGNNQAGVIV